MDSLTSNGIGYAKVEAWLIHSTREGVRDEHDDDWFGSSEERVSSPWLKPARQGKGSQSVATRQSCGIFRATAPMRGWNGSLCECALLGAHAREIGSHRSTNGGTVREAIPQERQER